MGPDWFTERVSREQNTGHEVEPWARQYKKFWKKMKKKKCRKKHGWKLPVLCSALAHRLVGRSVPPFLRASKSTVRSTVLICKLTSPDPNLLYLALSLPRHCSFVLTSQGRLPGSQAPAFQFRPPEIFKTSQSHPVSPAPPWLSFGNSNKGS